MEKDAVKLRPDEKILAIYKPEPSSQYFVLTFQPDTALIITNQRIINKRFIRHDQQIELKDIKQIRLDNKRLLIYAKEKNADHEHDTYEIHKHFIAVRWLPHPHLVEELIKNLITKHKWPFY